MRVKAGLQCPDCEGELYSEAGGGGVQTVCSLNREHVWTDLSVLRSRSPKPIRLAPRPDILQGGHVELSLRVPASVKAALEARFGDKLATSLTSMLSACAEPEMLLLNTADLSRITERTGTTPKSGGELFGLIYAQGEEIRSLKLDNERLIREAGVKRGGTGITLDISDKLSDAAAKAAEMGVGLEEMLQNYLRVSIENGWIQ